MEVAEGFEAIGDMRLRTALYEYPVNDLLKHCFGSESGISDNGGSLAAFDPYTFAVHASSPFAKPAVEGRKVSLGEIFEYARETLRGIHDTEERIRRMTEIAAWGHEVRHYHDCVCTPMGVRQWIDRKSVV